MATETLPRITSTKTMNKHGDTRGLHPNSLGNLKPTPFLPGNHANAKGNNGYVISARAKEKLPEVCPFDAQGRPWGEALSESLLRQALTRTDGMRELLDRTEGKVPGDQPPVTQDNRVLNIFVMDEKTKDLIGRVADRAKKLSEGSNNGT